MTVIALSGCRSTPLISYLQGLGVLRLLHNQQTPGFTSYWEDSTLLIDSELTPETVVTFFLDRYKPTPMVSPWNGGGGFRTLKREKGEQAVEAIENSDDSRFAAFQVAIEEARQVWSGGKQAGWLQEKWEEKPGGKNKYILKIDKPSFLAACRAVFPDDALDWLDTAVVLADDKKPLFPLLLGTGGNLGRLDLTTNHMEALSSLLDPGRRKRSRELLLHALFGEGQPQLDKKPVGQYSPGAAGTMNSWAFGSAESVANLWTFVLAMEGSLLLASGVARRFSGSRGHATTPFTVSDNAAGYLAAEGEKVKGEFWAPRWQRSLTVPELRRIFAEGRLSWRGRHAVHGLDAAKALSGLGVDRGLGSFQRFVIAERFGQSPLAAPVGTFPVASRPADRVSLLGETDLWVDRLRMAAPPASVRSALRRVDAAQIRVVRDPDSPGPLQDCLAEIALLEWIVSRSPDLKTRARSPIPPLSTDRWCSLLDDGTVEWKLAVAIATQRDRFNVGQNLIPSEQRGGAALCFLRPVKLPSRFSRWRFLDWADSEPGSGNPISWSTVDRLTAMLTNRAILCGDRQAPEAVQTLGSGAPVAFDRFWPVAMPQVATYLNGQIDDRRLGRLLMVAALLERPPPWRKSDPRRDKAAEWQPITPARAVLGPFFHPQPITKPTDPEEKTETLLLPSLSWPRQLQAGQTDVVIREALIRLRAAGYRPGVRHEAFRGTSTERLIGSLLIPTYSSSVRKALEMVCPPVPDSTLEGES